MARDPSTHYLKNKEILKEIHKSKMSYCWLADEQYFLFDHITTSLEEAVDAYADRERIASVRIEEQENPKLNEEGEAITEELSAWEIAVKSRATRLQKAAHEADVERWQRGEFERKTKPKVADYAVDIDTILDTDIVFRVLGYSHIPQRNRLL